jgi:hypothetical protein
MSGAGGRFVVYRSSDPGIVRAWARVMAAIDAYVARTAEIVIAAGADAGLVVRETGADRLGWFLGLAVEPAGVVPPGWRVECGRAVPDTRRAAGRWVAAALAAVEHPGNPRKVLAGMPGSVRAMDGVAGCGVEVRSAALYVTCPDVAGLAALVDHRRWELVPPWPCQVAVRLGERVHARLRTAP